MRNSQIEKMNETLGIATELIEEEEIVLKQYDLTSTYDPHSDIIQDYIVTRDTLKGLLSKGEYAIDKMLRLLGDDSQPRSFEVFATLMKAISDISGELLDLQKQMKEVSATNEKDITPEEDDDGGFSGSTNDLIDMTENDKR